MEIIPWNKDNWHSLSILHSLPHPLVGFPDAIYKFHHLSSIGLNKTFMN